jgi:hypothetical protein
MASVTARLAEGLLMDNNKNNANRKRTMRGLKMWFFRIAFLFKKPKKFSLG